ncbi:MAG TPA: hypothetical protein VJB62_00420, partial [Patescibacteria group bacterium]|nr:hypothetical protein [Patescibacteria group bacterium]
TSREIQSTRKRMQNIMANMQQVIKAVQAIRQQLDLTEPDENIPSVARDRRTLESLQKKLNSLSGQLNNLRAALLQEELGEARQRHSDWSEERLRQEAERLVGARLKKLGLERQK